MSTTDDQGVLTLERRGHVLLMGINRPEKRNAHGKHFTGGLDLAEVGPALSDGSVVYPAVITS